MGSTITNVAGMPALWVMECCRCGIIFAVPNDFDNQRRKDHQPFYCPSGHSQGYFDKTKEEKRIAELEQQLARERQAVESERSSRQWAESRAKGAAIQAGKAKAAKQRLEQRIAHGVCPCCHRSFKQLAAHMKDKHPEYAQNQHAQEQS
jgi:hypothetical protein